MPVVYYEPAMRCTLGQESVTLGPQPVRNQAAQQEASGGRASKASSAAAHHSPSVALPPEPFPPPQPRPGPWKNCLPGNWSLVPKRLGTAALPAPPRPRFNLI